MYGIVESPAIQRNPVDTGRCSLCLKFTTSNSVAFSTELHTPTDSSLTFSLSYSEKVMMKIAHTAHNITLIYTIRSMYVCVCTPTPTPTHTHPYTRTHTHAHPQTHTHTHTNTQTPTHALTHTPTHSPTHPHPHTLYVHTYTHTHI